jgi:phosphoribosylanthranilate isomerase
MLTQIYEISTTEEASALTAIGVDHIGVLVGDGRFPRELPISAASAIGAAIVPPSKFSALFLIADLSLIASWARELPPSIGLGPDNVAEAIRTVRPAGVDSKTRTDQDGSHAKDLDRVRRFHEAARAAAPS